MLTKTEFLTLVEREMNIISHLVGKLKPQHLGFRLTPAQRSTQELIEFLAVQLVGGVSYFITDSWDAWTAGSKQAAGITPAAFPAAVAAQLAEVRRLLAPLSESEFATRITKHPSGTPAQMPLPEALLTCSLGWIYGYKMQLFLQAKAAGIADIGSSNLWMGMEQAAKA